jgi:hypothetical protein
MKLYSECTATDVFCKLTIFAASIGGRCVKSPREQPLWTWMRKLPDHVVVAMTSVLYTMKQQNCNCRVRSQLPESCNENFIWTEVTWLFGVIWYDAGVICIYSVKDTKIAANSKNFPNYNDPERGNKIGRIGRSLLVP